MKSIARSLWPSNGYPRSGATAADYFGSSQHTVGFGALDSWSVRKDDNADRYSTLKERRTPAAIDNRAQELDVALDNEKQLDRIETSDGLGKVCIPLCEDQHIHLYVSLIPNDLLATRSTGMHPNSTTIKLGDLISRAGE